ISFDWSGVRCLNQSSPHSLPNALKQAGLNLEGDADEQLLIYIPFNQIIKLHSFAIKGPEEEEGPKTGKVFFSNNINDFPPSDTAELTEENIKGKPVVLKYVGKRGFCVFIILTQQNHNLDRSYLLYIEETTDMKGLKKIEDHLSKQKGYNQFITLISSLLLLCETKYKLNNIIPPPRFESHYFRLIFTLTKPGINLVTAYGMLRRHYGSGNVEKAGLVHTQVKTLTALTGKGLKAIRPD
ncbi:hypothetical protein DY000_02038626, partial [Brassica cretica]